MEGRRVTSGPALTPYPTADNYRQFGAGILNQGIIRYVVCPADSLAFQIEQRFFFESETGLTILLMLGLDVCAFLTGLQERREQAQDLLNSGSLDEWKRWRKCYFPHSTAMAFLDQRFK